MEFLSGAVGVSEGTTAAPPGFQARLALHGQNGSLTLEGGFVPSWKGAGCTEADYVDPQPVSVGGPASPVISPARHRAQLTDLLAAIQAGTPPPVSGEEGVKARTTVLGNSESSATGRWVDVA